MGLFRPCHLVSISDKQNFCSNVAAQTARYPCLRASPRGQGGLQACGGQPPLGMMPSIFSFGLAIFCDAIERASHRLSTTAGNLCSSCDELRSKNIECTLNAFYYLRPVHRSSEWRTDLSDKFSVRMGIHWRVMAGLARATRRPNLRLAF